MTAVPQVEERIVEVMHTNVPSPPNQKECSSLVSRRIVFATWDVYQLEVGQNDCERLHDRERLEWGIEAPPSES